MAGPSPARRVLEMQRVTKAGLVSVVALAAVACASTKFNSTWTAPGAGPLNFKGKKVVGLIVSKEEGVRYGAEDALAREITKQGAIGVAAYTQIPRELIQDKEKAKEFLEKAGVVGAVVMRVVGKDQQVTASAPSMYWGAPNYATFWGGGYYGWGWGAVYSPGYVQTDTIVTVEILIYSLEQNKLVWAAQSQTTNPSKVGPFIQELTASVAAQLKKQGLTR
jgi:hypothetical protein